MPARSYRGPLRISEADNSPDGTPVSLEFTDGAVTDQGDGTFFVDVTYGSTPPSIGGSLTSATPGSVLFVGGTTSAPVFAQDNQNLYWNDSTNRLSVFNTVGNTLVTNGTFTGAATGWTVPSGMAYSSNSVSKTSNGTGALVQSISTYNLREYILTYTISNWTAGTITPSVGSVTMTAVSADGTYTERFVALATTANLSFTPSNTARFTIDNISVVAMLGTGNKSNLGVGGFDIQGEWSNSNPGTTRAMTISNDGSYTWTDYRFAGVLRAAIGATASGELAFHNSGGSQISFYYSSAGLGSPTLYSYNTSTAFVHYSFGEFNYGLIAGGVQQPTSTLQTLGGLALKVTRVTTSQSMNNSATHWLADATTAAACSGTPSASCSSWTNQTDCEKWDAHGGCTWNAGSSCSAFNNEYGMGNCSGTSGCSVETASCSGGYDQSSCEAQDDSYGGGCTWNTSNDCSVLNEGTCGSTSGCTQNYSDCSTYNDNYSTCTSTSGCSSSSSTDCSAYDGTDQSTCEANSGCYWDGMGNCYMTCSGSYYTGCSGYYNTCDGTYNTGNCNGTYGSGCSGTSSCAGIDDSTNCGNETGCTWSTILNLTLPDGETCPDRTYWIKNDTSNGGDVVIIPYSGQKVEKADSYTLGNYGDAVHIAYYKQTYSCSNYATEGTCTPTGCTKNYAYCTWNPADNTCYGDAGSVCSAHNGDQLSCEAQQYFTTCTGTEIVTKNWYIF